MEKQNGKFGRQSNPSGYSAVYQQRGTYEDCGGGSGMLVYGGVFCVERGAKFYSVFRLRLC